MSERVREPSECPSDNWEVDVGMRKDTSVHVLAAVKAGLSLVPGIGGHWQAWWVTTSPDR